MNLKDKILVDVFLQQKYIGMLQQVLRSGVAFSHDPNTCAPYRMINWVEGEDTAAITGGRGGRVWQQAACSPVPPPPELVGVVALLEELLSLFGGLPVDCEFAVTRTPSGPCLWLLQARALIMVSSVSPGDAIDFDFASLENALALQARQLAEVCAQSPEAGLDRLQVLLSGDVLLDLDARMAFYRFLSLELAHAAWLDQEMLNRLCQQLEWPTERRCP